MIQVIEVHAAKLIETVLTNSSIEDQYVPVATWQT